MRRLALGTALGLIVAISAWFGVSSASTAATHPSRPVVSTVTHTNSQHAAAQPAAPAKIVNAKTVVKPAAPKQQSAAEGSDPEATGESAGETENGSATEGDTHEDPAGQDVNHECPPSCDTANGEQP